MTRQDKIKILKAVSEGKGQEALKQIREERLKNKISFVLSEISTPLLYLICYCRKAENKDQQAAAFIDAFFSDALKLNSNEQVKEFTAHFERENQTTITNYLQAYEGATPVL